jgi:hypothetical protein
MGKWQQVFGLGSNLAKMWESLQAKGSKELMPLPKTCLQCGDLIDPKLIGNFRDKFVMWTEKKTHQER